MQETKPLWPKPIPIIGGTGEFESGKAQPMDAKILTPNGWVTMADIKVGDEVVNPEGGSAKVVGVFPQGVKPVFRLTFSDGASTECCDEHLWRVKTKDHVRRGTDGPLMTLNQIRNHTEFRRFRVPLPTVTFSEREPLEVDPYTLGAMIGNGTLTQSTPRISTPDKEVVDAVAGSLPHGMRLIPIGGNGIDYIMSRESRFTENVNPVSRSLKTLGLYGAKSNTKFIPKQYLQASQWDRLKLLHGLCDTDGTARPGEAVYTTVSPRLASDLQELVRSLGGTAKILGPYRNGYVKDGVSIERQPCRVISIHMPEGLNPFHLPRKSEAYAVDTERPTSRKFRTIEPAGDKECQCIALDSDNHLYITDDYIVTHNTLFGLTISPGDKTLYLDFEQSGASYDELGHDRINVMSEMQKLHPKGYKPVDLFLWWLNYVRQLPVGKYRVIVLDPITDLERGMTDWVFANPTHFGHTAQQYQKMSGIAWGDLRDYYKSIVADLSVRCETLYYTCHLGIEFEGNQATGKKKVKGKSTLHELASVFLWFSRKPDHKGVKPNAPAARVLKSRLLSTRMGDDGELKMEQVLPPVMSVCTPKTLREAFAKPAGGREIDDIERHVEDVLSDEDRLRLEIQLAESQRDASLARMTEKGGNPAAVAGRPTAPPEADAEKWIADAADLPSLTLAGKRIAGAGYDDAAKARLKTKWSAKQAELKIAAKSDAEASVAVTTAMITEPIPANYGNRLNPENGDRAEGGAA